MRRLLLGMALTGALAGACGGDKAPRPATTTAPLFTTTPGASSTTTVSTGSTTSRGATTTSAGPVNRPGLNSASTVDLHSIGPVRIGMTLPEASNNAGVPIVVKAGGSPACSIAEPQGGPAGVTFMIVDNLVARVDVKSATIATRSGAHVGDTEAQVQARYSGRLEVTPHKYVNGGHYLTLKPTAAADQGFQVIFETDGSKVTSYRAGKLPEVGYVEGCA